MSSGTALAPDAAMALGIASTAMPFARTSQEEVERWLRVLRLHGQVGIALQALGVSEQPLAEGEQRGGACEGERREGASDHERARAGAGRRDAVALVTERAVQIAEERDAPALATTDLLMAVMDVYDEDFDRVLHVHGAERDELLQRLGV
jgi:hypothetical protein